MSEMIERVARAIDPLAFVIPEEDYPAERSRRGAKQFAAMSAAKRAIEEMREPTSLMFQEGRRVDIMALRNVTSIWQAMIDEALK